MLSLSNLIDHTTLTFVCETSCGRKVFQGTYFMKYGLVLMEFYGS